jgi:DnaJ homolog subfamily C member 7
MHEDTPNASQPEPAVPAVPADPLKEAEKKKEAGNTAFKAKKYQEAIERYTEAIGLSYDVKEIIASVP